jgi:hypothetical protein
VVYPPRCYFLTSNSKFRSLRELDNRRTVRPLKKRCIRSSVSASKGLLQADSQTKKARGSRRCRGVSIRRHPDVDEHSLAVLHDLLACPFDCRVQFFRIDNLLSGCDETQRFCQLGQVRLRITDSLSCIIMEALSLGLARESYEDLYLSTY